AAFVAAGVTRVVAPVCSSFANGEGGAVLVQSLWAKALAVAVSVPSIKAAASNVPIFIVVPPFPRRLTKINRRDPLRHYASVASTPAPQSFPVPDRGRNIVGPAPAG